MDNFTKLLAIVRRKSAYDHGNPWYSGPESYLQGLKDEVDEVIEELPRQRNCYLEDELGDLLWNCLNTVFAVEKETGITLESVLDRACRKFETRLSGLEAGRSWQAIKEEQKQALAREQGSAPADSD
ncbi:MAG TPA: MazG nucleotide pyrophosphohydrolase domain-containing protein [Azonexus sp.]